MVVWNDMVQILDLPGRDSMGILMVMMDNIMIPLICYLYTKQYVSVSEMDFIMVKLSHS